MRRMISFLLGWTDAPTGVNLDYPYEYVSQRKGSTGDWGKYSLPALWGRYSEDGVTVEYIYIRTTVEDDLVAPTTTTLQDATDDFVPAGYTDMPQGVNDTWPYEWIAERTGISGNWGKFNVPVLQWRIGQQGLPGLEGEDGEGFEYIFAVTDGSTPSAPNNTWGFDEPENPWSDGAPDLTATNHTLWRSDRTLLGQPDVGDAVADTWSTGTIVGRYGPRGIPGAGGEDGEGFEYIFAVTDGSTPSAPNNTWGFDEPENPWSDGAPDLTATNHTLWRSDRTLLGQPDVGDAVADTWSTGTIVGRYGPRGIPGAGGEDGEGFEYIFAVTDGSTPSAPNNTWGFDEPENPWSDGAPDLTATNHTLWRSDRTLLGQPDVGDAVADTWSTGTIVGRYGPDGVDGGGVEFIFRRTQTNSAPTTPTTTTAQDGTDDFVPALWTDDQQGVNPASQYEWVSKAGRVYGRLGEVLSAGFVGKVLH